MKKSTITILVVIGIIAIIIMWGVGINNKLVTKEESVTKAWSQVENVYQRRYDLIPQLVATAQGNADREMATFTAVTEARARATSVNIDANNLSEANVAAFQKAQDELTTSIGRAVNVIIERYPELAAGESFINLQTQLEGTENRIAVERHNFNDAVNVYNTYIRKFPTSVIAGMLGFEKKGYFTAAQGAEQAVKVEFNFNK